MEWNMASREEEKLFSLVHQKTGMTKILDYYGIHYEPVSTKGQNRRYRAVCPFFHAGNGQSMTMHLYRGADGIPLYECLDDRYNPINRQTGERTAGDCIDFVWQMESEGGNHKVSNRVSAAAFIMNTIIPEMEKEQNRGQPAALRMRTGTPLHKVPVQYKGQAAACQRFDELSRKYLMDPKAGLDGRRYLESRKVSEQTIRDFGIGYVPDNNAAFLEEFLKEKQFSVKDAVDAGILTIYEKKRQPYLRFRNRVVIPIRDKDGLAVGFTGRAIVPEISPKYLNSSSSGLFKKSEILFNYDRVVKGADKGCNLWICEGAFDVTAAESLNQHKDTRYPVYAVAVMGKEISDAQMALLRHQTRTVTLVFDADSAGQESIRNYSARLIREGMKVYAADLKKLQEKMPGIVCKDIKDFVDNGISQKDLLDCCMSARQYLYENVYLSSRRVNMNRICQAFDEAVKDGILNPENRKETAEFYAFAAARSKGKYREEEIERSCRKTILKMNHPVTLDMVCDCLKHDKNAGQFVNETITPQMKRNIGLRQLDAARAEEYLKNSPEKDAVIENALTEKQKEALKFKTLEKNPQAALEYLDALPEEEKSAFISQHLSSQSVLHWWKDLIGENVEAGRSLYRKMSAACEEYGGHDKGGDYER